MKKIYTFLVALMMTGLGFGQVMISQYIETDSGSTPKGIEVFNYSGVDIVFSASNNLEVYQGTNGAGCSALAGTNTTSGTLKSGEVWVIGSSDLTSFATTNGTDLSGTTTFGFSFNGDDALQLRLGGTIVDVFGTCGSDPGSSWTGGGVDTRNNNIQTTTGICTGTTTSWTNPSLRFETVANGSTMTGFGNSPSTCSLATAPTGVVTGTSGSITANSAIISSNSVGGDGGSSITERGVAYSTNPSPTTADDTQIVVGTTGTFNATLSGLNSSTLYYVRAYATNAEGTTYGSEIDFTTNAPAGDTDSDIISNTSYSYTSNIPYINYVTNGPLTTANSIEVGEFIIRDGGSGTDADDFDTILTSLTLALDNSSNLSRIALFDGTSNIAELAAASSVGFTGLSLVAGDNMDKTFSVRVSFVSTVTDNQQLSFTITSAAAQAGASLFSDAAAGGASTSISGDDNRLEVIATDLIFDQGATDAQVGNPMSPAPTVWAVDTNVNIDLDYSTNVSISSTGTLTGTTSVLPINGVATFSDLTHTAEGTALSLTASSGALTDDASSPFDVTDIVIFEKINSLAELTDGEYIILNKTEEFAMNSAHTGSLFPETAVTPVADQLEDPIDAIIWIISTDGSSRTIQSKNTNEYASYTGSSNDIQSVGSVTTDNQRWDFAFSTDEFIVTNAAVTDRTLRYNPSSPRFVCYGSTFGQNLILYKKAGGPVTYTFNGTWSPSNPNGTATAGDDIVIASGNATIDTNTTCSAMTVSPGAGLTVDSGVTLTATNGLTLESTSSTYSSLILDGTVAGTMTYERHVNINGTGTTGSNDLISAPLTGEAFNTFATANPNILSNAGGTLFLFGPFDKTIGDYVTYADTETATLDAGVGYRAASDDNNTFTFTGAAENGTIVIDIANSGPEFAQWNLIGNPYPSYINVQDFLLHDVGGAANLELFAAGSEAIYGYDGDATNGWTIYNLATTTASTVMAPGQGFFVSADATNAGLYDLEFTPAMRSTGTSDDFIVGRNAELVYLTVNLSSNSNTYNTDFYFNPNASEGFDLGYDASVWGGTAPEFSIYSHLVQDNAGQPMALQALNASILSDLTIPLGVHANQGEQLRFSIVDTTLPASVNVYLEDSVANTSTLLNTGDYVFTPTTNLSGTGRFFLRTSEDALSTIDNTLDSLTIFALNSSKELVVSGQLQENTLLNLYDIQGRTVLSTKLDTTTLENRMDISNLSGGVYVVTIENNGQQKTQKVVIK